jgi:hypothetical protein
MAGSSPTQLHSKRIGSSAQDPKELARLFWDIAETYCQDLPGAHTFRMTAFYGNGDQWQSVLPFVVTGRQDFDGMLTEGANIQGQMGQGMRWLEKGLSLVMAQTATLLDASNETIRLLTGSNSRLIEENHHAFEVVKDMVVERELNSRNFDFEKMKYESGVKTRDKWLGLLPPLANKLSGREIFPQNTEDTAILQALANELTGEDAEKIAVVLQKKPELLAIVAKRLNELVDDPNKKATITEETALAKTSPEGEFETKEE